MWELRNVTVDTYGNCISILKSSWLHLIVMTLSTLIDSMILFQLCEDYQCITDQTVVESFQMGSS